MNIIEKIEKEQLEKLSSGKQMPDFNPGDTIKVDVKVVEGTRERIQAFEGVCISRGGCLLYTSPSPRDRIRSRMPSSA